MAYFYILYSAQADKFYIGSTGKELSERVGKHNTNHKGFTGRWNDWNPVYFEEYNLKNDALARERQIKSWKSKKRIIRLIEEGK